MRLRNNTGTTITSLSVNWEGEQWYNKATGQQTMKLSYKVGSNVNNLTATGFTNVASPFFTAPYIGATVVVLDGNNSSYRAAVSNQLNVTILPGEEIMLRWADPRVANKDVMAIDNVTVSATGLPSPPVATSPTGVSSTRFTLNWIPGKYATGHYITVINQTTSVNLLEDYFVSGASTSSLYLPVDATPATTYTYSVRAYNSGSGEYSEESSMNFIYTYTEDGGPDYVFLGTNSSNWSDATSWSSNQVPGVYNRATIAANCFVNVDDAICNNLTINSGIVLTVNPGQMLTVNAEIFQTSGENSIVLKSNSLAAGGNGILVCGDDNTRGIIERYVLGSPDGGVTPQYHLVSVPIKTSTTPQYSVVFLDSYLAYYDEAENNWHQMNTPTNNAIYSSRGYLTYDPTDPNDTYLFTGVFNNGKVTMNVGYTDVTKGWCLVGNPFPTAVDWNSNIGWEKINIDNAVYIWDQARGQYISYVDGVSSGGDSDPNLIAPGQGFFVKANALAPSLIVNNEAKVTTRKEFFKTKNNPVDLLRLEAKIGEMTDNMAITFKEDASNTFDRNRDAYNLRSISGYKVPDLYSIDGDEVKYSVNAMPFDGELVVPVALKYESDALVTITATGLESFASHQGLGIYLEDTKTGNLINLHETPEYAFQYIASDDPTRFNLKFGNSIGIDSPGSRIKLCQVFANNAGELVFNHKHFYGHQGKAVLYDASGALIQSIQLSTSGYTLAPIDIPSGLILVRIEFNGQSESHKLIVH
jgi:hypothetical protein